MSSQLASPSENHLIAAWTYPPNKSSETVMFFGIKVTMYHFLGSALKLIGHQTSF